MAQTPYGDIVSEIGGRLRRETRSSSDVQTVIDEIDWYRKMVLGDMEQVKKQPGLEEMEKRSKLAKLTRNDDALAKLRMQAMDLKKEWEKSEAGKGK